MDRAECAFRNVMGISRRGSSSGGGRGRVCVWGGIRLVMYSISRNRDFTPNKMRKHEEFLSTGMT